MSVELVRAAMDAKQLLGKLGRASTPPVPDRGIGLRTHFRDDLSHLLYPAVFIGGSGYFREEGVACVDAHPNNIDLYVAEAEQYQALVVNCLDLEGPWSGADIGWAAWKSELIFDSCYEFKRAGVPVYLIKPAVSSVSFIKWSTVSDAIFPGFIDTAEETHNPHTLLWNSLIKMDSKK